MPKSSLELTNAGKDEIVKACEQQYRTTSFKEVTLKEIGKATFLQEYLFITIFSLRKKLFLKY